TSPRVDGLDRRALGSRVGDAVDERVGARLHAPPPSRGSGDGARAAPGAAVHRELDGDDDRDDAADEPSAPRDVSRDRRGTAGSYAARRSRRRRMPRRLDGLRRGRAPRAAGFARAGAGQSLGRSARGDDRRRGPARGGALSVHAVEVSLSRQVPIAPQFRDPTLARTRRAAPAPSPPPPPLPFPLPPPPSP